MFITNFIHYNKGFWLFLGGFKVIFVKTSQNFIKSHLKICLISQISIHSLWHVCFTVRSNLVPYAFVWKKSKTMDFSETIVGYDLKLATDDRSDKKFLLTSKLCPLGAVCPLPRGYSTCIKSWKKLYKIRLQRDFFETCYKRVVIMPFCQHQNFVPWGLSAPAPGLYTLY